MVYKVDQSYYFFLGGEIFVKNTVYKLVDKNRKTWLKISSQNWSFNEKLSVGERDAVQHLIYLITNHFSQILLHQPMHNELG